MKVIFESYDQYINLLVKKNILNTDKIYFSNNTHLINFICLRYGVNYRQIEYDNDIIYLTNKLGDRFSCIGKILKNKYK